MATSRSSATNPKRTLLALFAAMAAMTGVMFLQGSATPKLGLDLAGGTTVTLTAKTENGKSPSGSQMNQALEIMRRRVNGLGVSEAEASKQGSNVIVVNVPGKGQERVIENVTTTAQLQFRQVFAAAVGTPTTAPATTPTPTTTPTGKGKSSSPTPSGSAKPSGSATPTGSASSTPKGRALSGALTAPTPTPTGSAKAPTTPPAAATTPPPALEDVPGVTDKAVIAQFQSLSCADPTKRKAAGAADPNKQFVAACDQDGKSKYILGPVRVQGKQVDTANAVPPNASQGQGSWQVSLKFKSQGSKDFFNVTTDASKAAAGSPQRQVAIVMDGQVVSAPSIDNGAIGGGTASIYGPPESFTQQYAQDLANVLKYGALPLEFTPSSIDEVSSTLGADQLRGGLLAGAIGLGLVVFYSMLYYRGLGIVSVFSLVVAGAITYLSVVILGENIGFRLSLPHIIGLIVSIGITADSFIVYFERLRDELRGGKPLRPSVEVAWHRARRTILVADAVTFIAAVVLFFLAIGGVAGFAFAMGLTTLIDVVVVFLFTKPLVAVLAGTKFFAKGHKLSGLDRERLRRSVPAAPKGQEA